MDFCVEKICGQRHKADKAWCEDVEYLRSFSGGGFFGLADGQSGKLHCVLGANFCLSVLADYFANQGLPELHRGKTYDITRYDIARAICKGLDNLAVGMDCAVGELASTMMGVAVDFANNRFLAVHLGDGMILGVNKNFELETIARPENGFTKYRTYLTTSVGMAAHIHLCSGSMEDYSHLYLLTDGAVDCLSSLKEGGQLRELLLAGDVQGFAEIARRMNPEDDASVLALKI